VRVEKLTESKLEAMEPTAKGDLLVWERSGLGVRVGLRRKTFLCQYRLRGRQRRMTLGHWPHVSLPLHARRRPRCWARVDRGEGPASESQQRDEVPTLRQFSERYLEQHSRIHKRASSAKGDEWLFSRFLPEFGDLRLDAVTQKDVRRLHADRASTPYVANRILSLLSHVFKCGVEWGVIAEGPNPAKGIRRYPEPPRERFLSEAELMRLGDALRAHEAEHPLAVAPR
jgi:hypothetical protein